MSTDPAELVGRHRVRIFSGAYGHSTQVMAEGEVVGYSPRPMLLVRHDDGTQTWWSVDLPRVVLDPTNSHDQETN